MELASAALSTTSGHLRPLNILRDLIAVADLVELCFASTMDADGHSFVEQMRQNARDSRFLKWAPGVIDSVSLPLSGFVWEDNGKIVGNVSLIPFRRDTRRVTLIANVATHPDYRRRGIGRQLTESALQRARRRSNEIWLHVRADNPTAIHIYQQLGFVERARRTQWVARPGDSRPNMPASPALKIRPRRPADWEHQRAWLEHAHPQEINWHTPSPDINTFGPQWWNNVYRALADISLRQWAVEHNDSLSGVLAAQETYGRRTPLWLALPPKPQPQAVTALLIYARQFLSHSQNLMLEYPVGAADEGILAAGFSPVRSLLWMKTT
ncbi:MAG: hypothetical protein CO094_07020 [Anaerolineae bacterium CG_4_9_14_3_um_filter_57_17]|nr:GNAT family N-acetyltransferase [bacterium]NCT22114.1 GNAT family N-acetyltransferase [bacterium]OIO83880.1 MAG: hypothetical protein AUK01_11375 [Anaerolineae bacterium CG2_30_57_67]PJB66470.1 MAG: hypothetical protein CO094_07020 [Anaerolineae bacterium CG_4_9_14_3_um_filter_57_17]